MTTKLQREELDKEIEWMEKEWSGAYNRRLPFFDRIVVRTLENLDTISQWVAGVFIVLGVIMLTYWAWIFFHE